MPRTDKQVTLSSDEQEQEPAGLLVLASLDLPRDSCELSPQPTYSCPIITFATRSSGPDIIGLLENRNSLYSEKMSSGNLLVSGLCYIGSILQGTSTQYRYLPPDLKPQQLMGPANSLFHFSRRIATRKDEAQVTCSLWQGYKRVIQFRRNLDTGNQRHLLSLFNAVYAFEYPCCWNGDHHYARGVFITLNRGDFLADGMAQDQFFQAHTRAKFENG